MKYLYETYRRGDKHTVSPRVSSADSFEEVEKDFQIEPSLGPYNFENYFVVIHHLHDRGRIFDVINTREELEAAREGKERAAAWKPEVAEASLSPGMAERRVSQRPHSHANRRVVIDKTMSAPGQSTAYYKDTVPGMMYAEMMQYMLAGKDPVEAAYLAHIFKYLFRAGKKESIKDIREYRGALWYLNFLIAYLENDRKPIKASDVKSLVNRN
jgi:hypothetical protein